MLWLHKRSCELGIYKHNEKNRVSGNFANVPFFGYSVLEDINIVLKGVYSRINIFKPDNKEIGLVIFVALIFLFFLKR